MQTVAEQCASGVLLLIGAYLSLLSSAKRSHTGYNKAEFTEPAGRCQVPGAWNHCTLPKTAVVLEHPLSNADTSFFSDSVPSQSDEGRRRQNIYCLLNLFNDLVATKLHRIVHTWAKGNSNFDTAGPQGTDSNKDTPLQPLLPILSTWIPDSCTYTQPHPFSKVIRSHAQDDTLTSVRNLPGQALSTTPSLREACPVSRLQEAPPFHGNTTRGFQQGTSKVPETPILRNKNKCE
ncbi:hypothetical protein CONLIGDRAFT_649771 [Coniochaeta ligniaria NRRL 30616]|uniref:Uncharacterized protein n=1 Tax=Coniochaeta ligniaria NRRL 30616 TaxID=1408157 RepID=A0A1J7I735_9PEZI|nr:hypothetical protein CONLIGDRAFT_649771 [Coniochaeta ligniaria NRRL 30616]